MTCSLLIAYVIGWTNPPLSRLVYSSLNLEFVLANIRTYTPHTPLSYGISLLPSLLDISSPGIYMTKIVA